MVTKLILIVGLMLTSTNLMAGGEKSFYLSAEPIAGDKVLFQCEKKFHFASIWEIYNFSGLTYDTELGYTTESSGFGPPEGEPGWVSAGNNAGWASCENWTTTAEMGTFAMVAFWEIMDWGGDSMHPGDGWFIEHNPCAEPIRVWCVSN